MKKVFERLGHLHKDSRLFLYFCIFALIFSSLTIVLYGEIADVENGLLMSILSFGGLIFGSKIICFSLVIRNTYQQKINNSIFLINFLVLLESLMIPFLITLLVIVNKYSFLGMTFFIGVPILCIFSLLQRKADLLEIENIKEEKL